ncbi:hypothetical protein jhhlp_005546 [Lomentospora prolificans]|uniref:RRM domain-containing protein n=1 Tax=Lomentospora prolificans TaxID=41688 RepID=A0A2N3N3D6_9PEZI|nr:hypothetical protein jhhlp_005546 [Lomentospora prolificans]
MAAESKIKAKGSTLKNGKAKLAEAKKRKASEEEPAAKPKKIKAVKATEKENAGKTSVQEKTSKRKNKKAEEVANNSEDEAAAGTALVVRENDSDAEQDEQDGEAGDNEAEALAAEIDSGDEAEQLDKAIAQFEEGQDVGTIPKLSKKQRKALEAARNQKPGVVYVGRIPHGFYEHEMKQYFSQFGTINRLRLSRNKRTGASKHFAFIEFAEETTAEIVAKTMDNYLLFGHILKCKVVPSERVHKDIWIGANRRFKKVPWNKMVGNELSKPATQSAWERRVTREQRRRTLKAQKLKELGYDFSAPTLKAIPPPTIEDKPAQIEEAVADEKTEEKEVEEAPKALPELPAEPQPVEEPAEPVEQKPVAKASKAKKATKGRKGKSKA